MMIIKSAINLLLELFFVIAISTLRLFSPLHLHPFVSNLIIS